MIQGTLKADALAVTSIKVDLLTDAAMDIRAEAKLINTKDGATYATTTVTQFSSPDVREKVLALRDSIERYMASVTFEGGEEAGEGSSIGGPPADLGAHFNDGTKPL
jgi:hypothetical protein